MKSFSKLHIFAFILGLLLVGYAVFAFNPPTQAPPAGNAPTPLNVGPQTQTKQGGLIIGGEVRSNTLCIGGACRSAWPVELRSTDVVAGGSSSHGWAWGTGCNQPSDRGNRCDAYFQFYYAPWFDDVKYDPRGVLSINYSQALMPCYETPRGSSNSCGAQRTYPTSPSFSCSGGFTADGSNYVARAFQEFCESSSWQKTCTAAICRLP